MSNARQHFLITFLAISAVILEMSPIIYAADFSSQWSSSCDRVWVGPAYWANRLQDWRVENGHLECVKAANNKPLRTVHLLTRRLGEGKGSFEMSVRTGVAGNSEISAESATGFLIGAGKGLDYRAAALIHHSTGANFGLFAGINGQGQLFVMDLSEEESPKELVLSEEKCGLPADVQLKLDVRPSEQGYYVLELSGFSSQGEKLGELILDGVAGERLVGNVGLISHPGWTGRPGRFWYKDWRVSGPKFEAYPQRRCGPILSTQYTLSRGILKMTAQMMPLGNKDNMEVGLEVRHGDEWVTADRAKIIVPGYTATFRVENWRGDSDVPYRVVYDQNGSLKGKEKYGWSGTIRREPTGKEVFVLAGFTGNHNVNKPGADAGRYDWTMDNLWFPHNEVINHVKKHQPDFLFFSGDQVYESASPTAPVTSPEETARLDYLYKWYLWCWAYRDLTREIPSVCIPDDHDVFQGNLFGCSGKLAPQSWHDGGYIFSAETVNMIERTQTSHLPDPYDGTPVKRGIGVYYCQLNYGGISFAVIEDRKFKGNYNEISDAEIEDAHIVTPHYDISKADLPDVPLLGRRQLKFLNDWAADWSYGARMKVLLSQTIFCNLQTRDSYHDKLDRDLDSNGWPQTGRNKALRILRKGFAFHLAGDQHLGSIVHHGADEWDDAIWSFCVPSVANYYPRSWEPPEPGENHIAGMPRYTGQYRDGFGNHITVQGVRNPRYTKPVTVAERRRGRYDLYRKASGYGIVKLNKSSRTITMECWPRYADPSDPASGHQYSDWPITIEQMSNYGRQAQGYLPTIKINGMIDPVIQVIREKNQEIVYTLRIKSVSFCPKVFSKEDTFTIRVGDPDVGKMKILSGLKPGTKADSQNNPLEVNF